MHLVFDIFQGIGVAAAAGIRPFLPAVAAGALAAGDVQIDFNHTDYAFLQGAPFLIAMGVAAIVCAILEWRFDAERPPLVVVSGLAGAGVGALFFAGSLCRSHHVVWPGIIGGVVCAAIGTAATVPLLRRVRARLDKGTAKALPFYAEVAALLLAVLSVVGPPVGVIALAGLLLLLVAGSGRGPQKFAGLRILR